MISNQLHISILSSYYTLNKHCRWHSGSSIKWKKSLANRFIPVSLSHALCVRWFDVLLHYLFPASATKPAPEEALDFLDLPKFQCFLTAAGSGCSCTPCTRLYTQPTGQVCAGAVGRYWPPLLLQGTQLRRASQSLRFIILQIGY
jgi:hypothetical protein